MPLSPEDFVKRLDAISEQDGEPYGRAHLLFKEEGKCEQAVLKYPGYLALSDAFKCFFIETVELTNTSLKPRLSARLPELYAHHFLPCLANSFQSLCGAERVAIRGYPLLGYTLLRNIFDNIVLASAALQKFTDFYSIEGIERGKTFDINEARKLRKATEFAVRRKMMGNQSGLSKQTLDELAKWDSLFDFETHGGRLTRATQMSWYKGTDGLPVLPKFDEMAFGMFMNRFCEVGWMTHRLMPLVQPSGLSLPDCWKAKWQIIDESFGQTVELLTKECGKMIGGAIVEFVKTKFPFNEQSAFPL